MSIMKLSIVIFPTTLQSISLILIDKFGRIRGYYESNSEDEFERLSAELKILISS